MNIVSENPFSGKTYCYTIAVSGHGAIVSPLSRNAVDSLVGVNTQRCSNITGDKCNNGQGGARSGPTKPHPDLQLCNLYLLAYFVDFYEGPHV